ncbi:14328_t:CDS:2, partial [Gigaspora margarita]
AFLTNAEHLSGIATLNPYYVWYQCSSGSVTSMTYNIEKTNHSSPDTPNFGTKLLTTRNITSDNTPNSGFVAYGLDEQEQNEFLDYMLEKSTSHTFNDTLACDPPVESCKIGPVTPSNKPQIFCVSVRNPNNSTNNKLSISINFTSLTFPNNSTGNNLSISINYTTSTTTSHGLTINTSKGTSVQYSQMTLVIVLLVVSYYLTIFSF